MKKEFVFLLVLSLLAACSLPPSTGVVATSAPTFKGASYRVDLRTGTRTLKVGETVIITGTIVGGFGNPLYSIKLQDQGALQSALLVTLTPSNEVREKAGASNILTLVSTNVGPNQVTTVLQGHSPGVTQVSISVNGEIGETDDSGRWWFNYVTKFSEGLAITVTNQ
jgi:hypothetical protein